MSSNNMNRNRDTEIFSKGAINALKVMKPPKQHQDAEKPQRTGVEFLASKKKQKTDEAPARPHNRPDIK